MNQPDILAVYGTLRRGERAEHLLADAKYLGQSVVEGAIYGLGPFPAYKPAVGQARLVVVDLYELPDNNALQRCDAYEGYHEDDPEHSLYIRIRSQTRGNTSIPVWLYEYNGDLDPSMEITTGDWCHR